MRLVENNLCSSNGNGNICSPNTVTSSSTTTSNSAGAKTGTDATPKVSQRRKWCGLISHIDQNVGRVISALKAKKMYENTFIFVFSDNGGDVRTGASNHPYRGDKMSPWEGGTKSPAFIHSANRNLIPENLRGTESQALGHVTDLFPTLLGMVGGDTSPTKTGPLDGYDLYSAWKSGSNDSPRKEMLYNIDPFGLATAASSFMAGNVNSLGKRTQAPDPRMMTRMGMNGNIPEDYAAIRVGKYKLITGQPGRSDWYGTDPSETWKAAIPNTSDECVPFIWKICSCTCDFFPVFLFNIQRSCFKSIAPLAAV